MKNNLIRNINKKDIRKVLKIYNYHIENSLGNFEEKKISLREFNKLVSSILSKKIPFIVSEMNREITGFAFLNEYRSKSGYRFTFENSIYINPKYINKGLGNMLLKNLIKLSKKNKIIKNIIAVIGDSKNKSSITIHLKNGFKKIGTLKKIGFKKNKWIDSVYMQKKL